MFDAHDWIDRFEKAGGRMLVDGQTLRPSGPMSAEVEAIWSEIKGSAEPEQTRWKAVEAEIRRKVGDVGQAWVIYPDDTEPSLN